MSDFLVKLACRSAGVAPVLRPEARPFADAPRAQVGDASIVPDGPVHAHPAAGAFVSEGPLRTPPVSAQALPATASVSMPRMSVAPSIAVLPVVQRVAFGHFTPAVAAGTPAHSMTALPGLPIATAPAAAPSRPSADTQITAPRRLPDAPMAAHANPVAAIRNERLIEVHEHIPLAAPRETPAIADVRPEIRAAAPHAVEEAFTREPRAHESLHDVLAGPVASVALQSVLPSVAASAQSALAAAAPERVVHVHIGAIEIRGAVPVQEASSHETSVTSARTDRPADAASRAVAESGFDGYARLRSYAPWTW